MNQKDTTTPVLIAIVAFSIGFLFCELTKDGLIHEMFLKSIAIAILGSMTSFFLEFCYRPGNVFGWYMDFIEKYFRDNPKNPVGFLWKPLGGCIQCHNTWITLFYFIALYSTFDLSFWILIPTMVIGHMALSISIKLLWE
jgi:hypothetical protein